MATNTYQVEYAKTGRSGCKNKDCKKGGDNKIEAGSVRIGKNSPNHFSSDGDTKLDWYHPKCWFATQSNMKAASKKIESTDDLEGYDKLKSDDKEMIKDLIAGRGGGGGGKKKAAKKTAGKKRKAGSDDDDEGSGSDDDKKKKTKKKAPAKKKSAAASDDDEGSGSDDDKPKKKKAKAAPKKKKADSDDDDGGSDDDKPKKKSGGGGGGKGKVQHYEVDGKFWEVSVSGDSMTVTFGKIGTGGQTQVKPFANNAAANKEMAKLIKAKEKKGYSLQD